MAVSTSFAIHLVKRRHMGEAPPQMALLTPYLYIPQTSHHARFKADTLRVTMYAPGPLRRVLLTDRTQRNAS